LGLRGLSARSARRRANVIELGDELERGGEKILNTNCGEPETDEDRQFIGECETVLATGAWYRKLGEEGFGVAQSRTLGMALSITDQDPLQARRW
jgi:hypothetical protein